MVRKTISFTDHAWLRLDDPNNLMIITGLMTFDAPLDYQRLVNTIEHAMLPIQRFRQRLVPSRVPLMRPHWEDDPKFNLESHLERVVLPAPAGQEALLNLISLLMSTPLDYNRPLWQFYLIENYGAGSAFIARLHHSLADGIALMQVLLSLTDTSPDSSRTSQPGSTTVQEFQLPGSPPKTHQAAVLGIDSWTARGLWEEGKKLISNPSHLRDRSRQVIGLAATVGKLALRWPDPSTVYKGDLGFEKRAAWSDPIELKDIKYIGKTFNSTVNDILLTAASGALGRYIHAQGQPAEDVTIRGVIPVNLRPLSLDQELGNKFGLVFLPMPIGVPDPIERLRLVKQNMDDLKSSPEAVATYGVLNLFGAVPARVEDTLVDFFDTKGTSVITNVPGPQVQLYLAGAPINTVMAWVPQSGRIALGISIISYNGKVRLGVATDKGLVPDPETIVTFFVEEFQELLSRAQQTPADRITDTKAALSLLDESLQTLDELLARTAQS